MSQVQNLLLELHNERTLKEQFLRERNEYREEAKNERELSESIVVEREKLYLQVEEMQKTLEWYADKENHSWTVDFCDHLTLSNAMKDEGERARQALKGDIQ